MSESASERTPTNSPILRLVPLRPPPPPPPPPHGHPSDGGTGADVGSSSKSGRLALLVDFILRLVAIVTTLIATIVVAVNRQTVSVDSIKAMSYSQLRYFVAVNAIVFVYASGSLALSFQNRRSSSSPSRKILMLAVLDVVMVAFLFSGVGSASAISVWFTDTPKFCNTFGTFCSKMGAAIAMCTIGAVAFLALTVLSIVGLHSRSMWSKHSSSAVAFGHRFTLASNFVSPANDPHSAVVLGNHSTSASTPVSSANDSHSAVVLGNHSTLASILVSRTNDSPSAVVLGNYSTWASTPVSPANDSPSAVVLGNHSTWASTPVSPANDSPSAVVLGNHSTWASTPVSPANDSPSAVVLGNHSTWASTPVSPANDSHSAVVLGSHSALASISVSPVKDSSSAVAFGSPLTLASPSSIPAQDSSLAMAFGSPLTLASLSFLQSYES